MNLFDCGVPYTVLPETILGLNSKSAMLTALEIYRSHSPACLEDRAETSNSSSLSPYQLRVRSETRRELLRREVLTEADGRLSLIDLDMEADRKLASDRLIIPTRGGYSRLGLPALKSVIALHRANRYSRTPFRLTLTQQELAKKAGISERSVSGSLRQLVAARFVSIRKIWQTGTEITLLEPESGAELYHLGEFYRVRMDSIPVYTRYKTVLANFDPRNQLKDTTAGISGYTVYCPFCTRRGSTPTFRFSSLEDDDQWHCFRCGRSGDSARLWTRMVSWFERTDWRQMLNASVGSGEVATDPAVY
jgi:DNA-binding MarR family transcriptional regulator